MHKISIDIYMIIGVSGCGKSFIGTRLKQALDNRSPNQAAIFIEGDHYHTQANIEKMRAGTALNDSDRWIWLENLTNGSLNEICEFIQARRDSTNSSPGKLAVIISCSCLKKIYRDYMRKELHNTRVEKFIRQRISNDQTNRGLVKFEISCKALKFIHLKPAPKTTLEIRLRKRSGNSASSTINGDFMSPGLVSSQLETWEDLDEIELKSDSISVDNSSSAQLNHPNAVIKQILMSTLNIICD